MDQVIIRDGIGQEGPLRILVEEASARLKEMLDAPASLVSAEWDRAEDSLGRSVVILRLSDFAGSVTATFDPKELEQPAHLRDRFRRLWGDLLQVRSRKQLEAVLGAGGDRGE